MTRSRRNNFSKTIKDYIVPIIGFLLIVILIFSFFSGNSTSTKVNTENQVGINVTLDSDTSESYIIYPGDKKKQIEQNITLYKGEKVVVKNGTVSLDFPSVGKMNLNKIGELKYSEDGELFLFSSDLRVNNSSPVIINMRYGSVKIGENSVISLTQNEMGSTIYLISGFAEASNISGKSTVLAKGQKITISRQNATKNDVDLSLLKEDIDDYFKSSDWFIKNNGEFYLSQKTELETSSTGTLQVVSTNLISFDNLSDESSVKSSSITITGKYKDENISKITLNSISASLDQEAKTFSFAKTILENKVNDLVFKVYSSDDNVIKKYIYTVYYDSGVNNISSTSGFQVTNFEIDASNFKFTSPSTTGTFSTYDTFVTIKGLTPAKTVSSISVNGYILKSFNGTSWRYHARVDYNNLKNGTNIYEVKYYGSKNNLIYINYFTIIKKVRKISNTETTTTKEVYSDEAKIN